MWTQTYANGQKYQFFNPMTQNKYHINALSKYLEVPDEYFVSYIVFGEQCELKKMPQNTDRTAIMDLHTLPKKTELDLHNRPYMFSDSVVDMFSSRISELTDRTGQKKRNHIEQVKKLTLTRQIPQNLPTSIREDCSYHLFSDFEKYADMQMLIRLAIIISFLCLKTAFSDPSKNNIG